jgi:hypothetical protein
MPDTSTRNSLALPLSGDGGQTFFTGLHTNFEQIDLAIARCNWTATTDPAVTDDISPADVATLGPYSVGSLWWNITAHRLWCCEDNTNGAAVWRQIWPVLANGWAANRGGLAQTGINTNSSSVKILFNSVASPGFDTSGTYDTTNSKMIISTAGTYVISVRIELSSANTLSNRYLLQLFKNGSEIRRLDEKYPFAANQVVGLNGTAIANFAIGDEIEIYIYGVGNNSVNTLDTSAFARDMYFSGIYVGE